MAHKLSPVSIIAADVTKALVVRDLCHIIGLQKTVAHDYVLLALWISCSSANGLKKALGSRIRTHCGQPKVMEEAGAVGEFLPGCLGMSTVETYVSSHWVICRRFHFSKVFSPPK